jgi:hypothetical protein
MSGRPWHSLLGVFISSQFYQLRSARILLLIGVSGNSGLPKKQQLVKVIYSLVTTR